MWPVRRRTGHSYLKATDPHDPEVCYSVVSFLVFLINSKTFTWPWRIFLWTVKDQLWTVAYSCNSCDWLLLSINGVGIIISPLMFYYPVFYSINVTYLSLFINPVQTGGAFEVPLSERLNNFKTIFFVKVIWGHFKVVVVYVNINAVYVNIKVIMASEFWQPSFSKFAFLGTNTDLFLVSLIQLQIFSSLLFFLYSLLSIALHYQIYYTFWCNRAFLVTYLKKKIQNGPVAVAGFNF